MGRLRNEWVQVGIWTVRLSGVPGSYTLHLMSEEVEFEYKRTYYMVVVSRGRKYEYMKGQMDLMGRMAAPILGQIYNSIPVRQKVERDVWERRVGGVI